MENVQNGLTFTSACRLANLQPKCVKKWLEKGELLENENLAPSSETAQYVRFFLDFEAAKAKYEQIHAININNNAIGTIRTRPDVSQWALKTYYPERYEEKSKIQREANKMVNELFRFLMASMSPSASSELATLMAGVQGFKLERDESAVAVYRFEFES